VFYNTVTGDVAKVSSTVNVSSFSAGTTGFTPSTATTGAVTLAGTLATTNGGTGLTSFTANGVVYASSTSALATGSALQFDGTNLSVTSPSTATTFTLSDNAGRLVILKNSLGSGGTAEVGTTTNHDFYVRAGVSSGGLNSLYLQAGGVTGYSLNYAGVSVWSVGGSEQMRLTSTGLGIGTSSPTNKLHVYSTASTTISIFETSGADAYVGIKNSGSTGYLGVTNAGNFIWETPSSSYSTKMTLDNSGNLGLGVTPSAWTSIDKEIEIGRVGNSIYGGGLNEIALTANTYYSSGWKYAANGYANRFDVGNGNGTFTWFTAAPGTVGGGGCGRLGSAVRKFLCAVCCPGHRHQPRGHDSGGHCDAGGAHRGVAGLDHRRRVVAGPAHELVYLAHAERLFRVCREGNPSA
jgi:hypothetical protein